MQKNLLLLFILAIIPLYSTSQAEVSQVNNVNGLEKYLNTSWENISHYVNTSKSQYKSSVENLISDIKFGDNQTKKYAFKQLTEIKDTITHQAILKAISQFLIHNPKFFNIDFYIDVIMENSIIDGKFWLHEVFKNNYYSKESRDSVHSSMLIGMSKAKQMKLFKEMNSYKYAKKSAIALNKIKAVNKPIAKTFILALEDDHQKIYLMEIMGSVMSKEAIKIVKRIAVESEDKSNYHVVTALKTLLILEDEKIEPELIKQFYDCGDSYAQRISICAMIKYYNEEEFKQYINYYSNKHRKKIPYNVGALACLYFKMKQRYKNLNAKEKLLSFSEIIEEYKIDKNTKNDFINIFFGQQLSKKKINTLYKEKKAQLLNSSKRNNYTKNFLDKLKSDSSEGKCLRAKLNCDTYANSFSKSKDVNERKRTLKKLRSAHDNMKFFCQEDLYKSFMEKGLPLTKKVLKIALEL